MTATAQIVSSQAQPPPKPPIKERANNGQFGPGNRGGPGNPFIREVAAMRKTAHAAISHEEMHNLFRHMYQLAMNGNVQAAKFVASYLLGKPADVVNPDTVDRQEIDQMKCDAVRPEEIQELTNTLQPELALTVMREVLPCVSANFADALGAGLEQRQEDTRAARKARKRAGRRRKKDRERRAEDGHETPIPNGGNGHAAPSTKGAETVTAVMTDPARHPDGPEAPSTNGANGAEIVTGVMTDRARHPDGDGQPSTNGDFGAADGAEVADEGPPAACASMLRRKKYRVGHATRPGCALPSPHAAVAWV